MKKILIFLIVLIIVIVIILFWPNKEKGEILENIPETDCGVSEMIFYYSDYCGLCSKVKDDGIIDSLKNIGIRIEEIDVKKDVVRHQFEGIPTFVIDNVVYSGYKTFDQLEEILKCN